MHPSGAGDYAPYYPSYPAPAAPSPTTYPSVSAPASAPPYSPYPTDFAPAPSYPAYPPAQPVDLPHYAPPAATPPPPQQPYYPYEPLLPSPHNPVPSLDRAGSYGYGSGSGSGYGQELYPPKPASGGGWSDEGVYAYDGGDAPEPYGARGTAPRSGSGSALFDDYGRSIGSATDKGGRGGSAASPKVVRAVPKAETTEDVRGGVQKFRVKLLPEGAGSPMDVLCQVVYLFLFQKWDESCGHCHGSTSEFSIISECRTVAHSSGC